MRERWNSPLLQKRGDMWQHMTRQLNKAKERNSNDERERERANGLGWFLGLLGTFTLRGTNGADKDDNGSG